MRILRFVLLGLASCIAIVLFEDAHASPASASMSLTATAIASGGTTQSDPETMAWGPPFSTLMISSTATATDNNGGTLAVYGSGTATWRGPDAGTVSFTNYGWTTNGIVGDVCLYCDRLGPDWEYTFTARTDGYFTMTYNVSGTGSAYFGGFGLNGWQIELDGIVVDDPTNVLDPDVSGTFSWPLLRDVTYTFALQNIANIHDNIPADISSMSGEFDWSISVPEPSSLTLLLSSMLGLLFMLRRGRV